MVSRKKKAKQMKDKARASRSLPDPVPGRDDTGRPDGPDTDKFKVRNGYGLTEATIAAMKPAHRRVPPKAGPNLRKALAWEAGDHFVAGEEAGWRWVCGDADPRLVRELAVRFADDDFLDYYLATFRVFGEDDRNLAETVYGYLLCGLPREDSPGRSAESEEVDFWEQQGMKAPTPAFIRGFVTGVRDTWAKVQRLAA